jgi:Leucine-rich repeat (LRR) protein
VLPAVILRLQNLEVLNLDGCGLDEIPDALFAHRELAHLSLMNTPLKRLPECVGDAPALVALDLGGSALRSLPDALTRLRTLEYLDVSATRLTKLPERIGELPRLRSLNLRSTRIATLPASITALPALEQINVAETPLKELPPALLAMPLLKSIDLSSSKIRALPEIAEAPALVHLDLQHLRLKTLPPWLVDKAPKLADVVIDADAPLDPAGAAVLQTLRDRKVLR